MNEIEKEERIIKQKESQREEPIKEMTQEEVETFLLNQEKSKRHEYEDTIMRSERKRFRDDSPDRHTSTSGGTFESSPNTNEERERIFRERFGPTEGREYRAIDKENMGREILG